MNIQMLQMSMRRQSSFIGRTCNFSDDTLYCLSPIQHEHTDVTDVNETTEFFHFINSCNFFDSREENKKIKKYVGAASVIDAGGDDKLTFFSRA